MVRGKGHSIPLIDVLNNLSGIQKAVSGNVDIVKMGNAAEGVDERRRRRKVTTKGIFLFLRASLAKGANDSADVLHCCVG